MDNRIGAQLFTLRNFCKTLEDFDESCRKVSEMGYKVVQLSGIGDFSGDDVKAVLDKYNLICACTHRPAAKYLEHLEEEIKFHKTIGCKVCGLGAIMEAIQSECISNDGLAHVEKFAKDFGPVCEALAKEDLIFAYHNHGFEFAKINGKFLYDEIIERMPYDNFKLIVDVYWLSSVGINPKKFIEKYGDKIICLHYKDLKVVKHRVQTYTEVGQGNLDWDEIIEASMNCGAEYALVELDECDKDPFEALKISYDFLVQKGFE